MRGMLIGLSVDLGQIDSMLGSSIWGQDSSGFSSLSCRPRGTHWQYKPEIIQFCRRVGSLGKKKQAFTYFVPSKEEKHPVSNKLMENNTRIKIAEVLTSILLLMHNENKMTNDLTWMLDPSKIKIKP